MSTTGGTPCAVIIIRKRNALAASMNNLMERAADIAETDEQIDSSKVSGAEQLLIDAKQAVDDALAMLEPA